MPDDKYRHHASHFVIFILLTCNSFVFIVPNNKKLIDCPHIGFHYENDIVITKEGCEFLSKYPLGIEEIS
jgi:hypothetical protein